MTSLGMLKKINHPSYKYLEWKFRAEVLDFTTNFWPIVQGCSDDEALEYWKDIANLLELDEMTWRHLILMVHQGVTGRAAANKLIWDLLTQYAIMEHVDLNHKAMSLITDCRKLIDRPPSWHDDAQHWTFERALQPTEIIKHFAAEAVPEGPQVTTGNEGQPLVPPHCWYDQQGNKIPKKAPRWEHRDNLRDGGSDRRASRRHASWTPNRGKKSSPWA